MAHTTKMEIKRALARHTGSMELATRVVETGISTIGSIHRDAADEVVKTLKIADGMIKGAEITGRVTPEKKATIARRTQLYLDDILIITDDAAAEIIDAMIDIR